MRPELPARGITLESKGIAIIPCGGKTSIDRPAIIFQQLGIPVFLIWDSDKGGKDPKAEFNRKLLKLMGRLEEEYPNMVHENFACFEENLEKTLCAEIGKENFEGWLIECQDNYCYIRKDAIKNPIILSDVIQKGKAQGKTSQTIQSIIDKILEQLPQDRR